MVRVQDVVRVEHERTARHERRQGRIGLHLALAQALVGNPQRALSGGLLRVELDDEGVTLALRVLRHGADHVELPGEARAQTEEHRGVGGDLPEEHDAAAAGIRGGIQPEVLRAQLS